ncbi:MAG: GNAT family N-acetyltransferase [Treponema sp.]|nr:GNAT family N-acetyltransferase [Treponema sp.]
MNNDPARQNQLAEYRWRKMKKKDIPRVDDLLREIENDYAIACGRYMTRDESKDSVWLLCGKNGGISALVINSGSTVIPVLCGMQKIPKLDFPRGFFREKKIHAIQGLKNEVLIFEDAVKKFGWMPADIIDYNLMSIDRQKADVAEKIAYNKEILIDGKNFNLVLKAPRLSELDAIAPMQAAYEQEEVIPKGSVFNPAASRLNIANIIAKGRILAAQINGRFIGKINVSSVSFTKFLVGGVYVHPDFRGRGIARLMASAFIGSLLKEGKGVTLFVKKSNTAACRLYSSLGFTTQNDYRITYY